MLPLTLPDLEMTTFADVTGYRAVDFDDIGLYVGTDIAGLPDRNLIAIQIDDPFNASLDKNVFITGYLAFDDNAGPYHYDAPYA
jgi:hypothetical protein